MSHVYSGTDATGITRSDGGLHAGAEPVRGVRGVVRGLLDRIDALTKRVEEVELAQIAKDGGHGEEG